MTDTEGRGLSHRVRRDLASVSQTAGDLVARCITSGDTQAAQMAHTLNTTVCRVCEELREEGVTLPALPSIPLHLLDTPANRRYLDALVEAHRCALEVDRERGYGEDGPAQDLEDRVAEVRMEVYGPTGVRE